MLPTIDVEQMIPQAVVALPEAADEINGNMPLADLAFICRLVAHLCPRTAFEIGTFRGVTTHNIAKYSDPDAIVYTLDLPPHSIRTAFPLYAIETGFADKTDVGAVYRQYATAHKIVQLLGDSAIFDFSRYCGLMDFTLIDASHTYANCISDSLRALTMRSQRGVIAWHDYSVWDGVTAALNDLQSSADGFKNLRHVAGTGVAVLLQ